MNEPVYIVSVSGGLGSFEAWRRCLEKHGPEKTIPVFADVGSVYENGKCVSGEDEDLFRFLDDTERLLGQKIIRLKHPKYNNIWEAFFDQRYVTNGRVDNCSKYLKREVLHKFARQYENHIWVLGYSWLEESRAAKFKDRMPNCWFPLTERPYVTNDDIIAQLTQQGILTPKMYLEGFSHHNCGGACFKAGLGPIYDLLKIRPERYEYNERMQEKFLSEVSPHGTFMKKGKRHISLKEFREMVEEGYTPSTAQYTSCGGACMLPEQADFLNLL